VLEDDPGVCHGAAQIRRYGLELGPGRLALETFVIPFDPMGDRAAIEIDPQKDGDGSRQGQDCLGPEAARKKADTGRSQEHEGELTERHEADIDNPYVLRDKIEGHRCGERPPEEQDRA